MPLPFFKSKRRSTSKPNTIKKVEPVQNHTSQGDARVDGEGHIVDITNVGAWVKESAVDKIPTDAQHPCAILRGKEPDRATIVNGLDTTHSGIKSQEATTEECSAEASPQVDEPNSPDSKPQHQQMINLILGHQDPPSPYFTRRHMSIPASSLPHLTSASSSTPNTSSANTFPFLDPHAFELYHIYLHTGTISPRSQIPYDQSSEDGYVPSWQAFWPLFNAHILGCKIGAIGFLDQVMDVLVEKLCRKGGRGPDEETIVHIFTREETDVAQVMRDFVVDQFIEANSHSAQRNPDVDNLPPPFLRHALQRALTRLSNSPTTTTTTQDRNVEGCIYHTHTTPETCYKHNIPTWQVKRQQRLELERQKSLKDGEEVRKNVEENGVRSIDWEERRGDAIGSRGDRWGGKTCDATEGDRVDEQVIDGGLGQDGNGLEKSEAETMSMLNPAVERIEDGKSRTGAPTSTLRQGVEEKLSKARSAVVPGAFPLSRNGSRGSGFA